MVYRKKARGRKKAVRKRGMRKMRIPRIISGIETCKMVKLTYADQIRLDPQIGGIPQTHVFRCNSLFDPDLTSVGHSPMFFSQYSQLYGNYKVYGSKITITGCNDYSDSANNTGNLIVCNVSNTPQVESSYTESIERKNSVYRQCIQKRPFYLKNTYSAKKFHCIKDVKDAVELEGLTGGTGVGTNPSQQAYYVVSAHPLYKGQDTYAALLNVKIEYVAMFFNTKRVDGS